MMNLEGEEEFYEIQLKIIDDDLPDMNEQRASNDAAHLSELSMCWPCI